MEVRPRRDRPDLEPLFSDERPEPLLIKNLESVQGDERDVVFLSMGCGKDQNGKFYKRFGPINQQGGERRLNVAVTRARERLVFISSVRAVDMDIAAGSRRGPHLLKAYLDYAERGVETLGKESIATGRDFDSPFESEVCAALEREGFDVRSQIGCGGYRIDLALVHPDEPGRFVLGIECDGASYHSSRTARDRDRLRQLVLEENLGWSIHRIWSTDWIRDPSAQIARIRRRYAERLNPSPRPVAVGDAREDSTSPIEPVLIERSAGRDVPVAGGSIDEVPDQQISEICRRIVTRHGATEWDDLIRQIARDLGYARTGSRIKRRIERVLKLGIRQGRLTSQDDGRLTSTES